MNGIASSAKCAWSATSPGYPAGPRGRPATPRNRDAAAAPTLKGVPRVADAPKECGRARAGEGGCESMSQLVVASTDAEFEQRVREALAGDARSVEMHAWGEGPVGPVRVLDAMTEHTASVVAVGPDIPA